MRFTTFLAAGGGTEFPALRKKALLLHCVGAEAQRIFNSLPAMVKADGEDDYTATLRRLREFYSPQVNVIVERFTFRRREQHHDESTADYVAELRRLALNCDFGNLLDEMIRDHVVEKTLYPKLREKFLQNKNLTLAVVLTQAEAYERSVREARLMAEPATCCDHSSTHGELIQKASTHRSRKFVDGTGCGACGAAKHRTGYRGCPARQSNCRQCGKRGHWAAVCRSLDSNVIQKCEDEMVLTCGVKKPAKRLMCSAIVCAGDKEKTISLQVDTGATVSLFSLQFARQQFKGTKLNSTMTKLYGVGQAPLDVVGTLPVQIRVKDRHAITEFYVVKTAATEARLDGPVRPHYSTSEWQGIFPSGPACAKPATDSRISTQDRAKEWSNPSAVQTPQAATRGER